MTRVERMDLSVKERTFDVDVPALLIPLRDLP